MRQSTALALANAATDSGISVGIYSADRRSWTLAGAPPEKMALLGALALAHGHVPEEASPGFLNDLAALECGGEGRYTARRPA
jgi:hypothetical protein